MGNLSFPSIEAFYAADERRRWSRELDFGVWWRQGTTIHRITWVDDTGELIAVRLSGPEHARLELEGEVLEIMRAGDEQDVTVLGVVHGEEVVERLLNGWAEMCGEQESFCWVLDRVREAGLEATP